MNASRLPQPMTDGSLAPALQRMKEATGVLTQASGTPHLRYELKMEDYKGNPHTGTYEMWRSSVGSRTEIHTDTYNWSELTKSGQSWVIEDGVRPLRIMEFTEDRLLPRVAVTTVPSYNPPLKKRKINEISWMCGGDSDKASFCFDASTGLMTLTTRYEEKIEYEGWKQINSTYLASIVRMTYGKHLLFEAKLTEVSDEVSPEAFSVPTGADLLPTGYRISPRTGIMSPATTHPLKRKGETTPQHLTSTGEAQIKVWVDEHGKVTKAEVEDADDKDLASAALEQAKSSLYEPYRVDGNNASFETTYFMSVAVGMGKIGNPSMTPVWKGR
jgi:hypothetical protein